MRKITDLLKYYFNFNEVKFLQIDESAHELTQLLSC